jgi:ESCRT-I complex subunit VPS37
LDSEKDKIISENRALAESNLTKEPQLIELRAKVNEVI